MNKRLLLSWRPALPKLILCLLVWLRAAVLTPGTAPQVNCNPSLFPVLCAGAVGNEEEVAQTIIN